MILGMIPQTLFFKRDEAREDGRRRTADEEFIHTISYLVTIFYINQLK
jgi:hypothetical protein